MRIMIPEMQEMDVVLSGSSTKFPAHLGFLLALRHHGIKPARVASNSGGTLVAAMWLAGYSLDEIQDITMKTDFTDYVPLNWQSFIRLLTRGYLSTGVEYLQLLQKLFGQKKMRDIDVPFYVMTSDITNGKLEVITQTTHPDFSLALAVYISSCMPLAFKPVTLDGISYRDGGVYKNFPIDIWKDQPRWRVGHLVGQSLRIEPKKWWGLREEASMLADRIVDANMDNSMEQLPDKDRTIIIESDGYNISTLKFDIPESLKQALKEQGFTNTSKLLSPYSKPINEEV